MRRGHNRRSATELRIELEDGIRWREGEKRSEAHLLVSLESVTVELPGMPPGVRGWDKGLSGEGCGRST